MGSAIREHEHGYQDLYVSVFIASKCFTGPRAQFRPNPAMQQSFQRNFGAHAPPPPMAQKWVNQMSIRPPAPMQMDMAWKNGGQQAQVAQNWAKQINSNITQVSLLF